MCTHRNRRSQIDIEKLCAVRDYFLRLPNQVALFSAEERESSLLIALYACHSEGVDDPVTAISRIIQRGTIYDLGPQNVCKEL